VNAPPRVLRSANRACAALALFVVVTGGGVRAAEPAPAAPSDWICGLPEAFARRAAGTDRFEVHRGLKPRLAAAKENRRLLEDGHLRASAEDLPALTMVSGNIAFPVLMGYYSGQAAPPIPVQSYANMLFNNWPTGTLTQYYEEVSYGNLNLTGTVLDWFRVSHNGMYYYGDSTGLGSDAHVDEFIRELLVNADATVDFRIYDNDGPGGVPNDGNDDGYADFVAVVHFDIGGEFQGNPGIWSHRSRLSNLPGGAYVTNDIGANGFPIVVDDYTIMSGLNAQGMQREIGVFAHEIGHAFGLPDLYDTKPDVIGASAGIGSWGIMGGGTWQHPERPPHFCAWSKKELGWINPAFVTSDLFSWPVASSTTSPTAFRLWTGGAANTPEYFLVEYRRRTGFDQWLPGDGVLIWHIKENNYVAYGSSLNGDERNKRVDLECADQILPDHLIDADDLDQFDGNGNGNTGDVGDMWCQSAGLFGNGTTPSSVSYGGVDTDVQIRVTGACGGTSVNVNLIVGNLPTGSDVCIRDCTTDTCFEPSTCENWWASPDIYINNGADGVIDPPAPGLSNRMWARVTNQGTTPAVGVKVDLYQATPTAGLSFPGPTSTLVGTRTIDLIGPFGDAKTVFWDYVIPPPPQNVDHYCFGVVASAPGDPQSSPFVKADNNVAQINVQELYAKAGDTPPTIIPNHCDGTMHALRSAQIFEATRRVQLCNNTPDLCQYSVKIGSPPNYDDAVIPDDWTVNLSTLEGMLGVGACAPLDVTVKDSDAHHLDYAIVPITLLCEDVPVGGDVLEFHIDNFPPHVDCDMFQAVRQIPPGTDHFPLQEAIRVEWDEALTDSLGYGERVKSWSIHRGTQPNFQPTALNEVLETCLDGDLATPRYDAAFGLPVDPNQVYYKIASYDRAGNNAVSCAFQAIAGDPTDASAPSVPPARFALSAPRPNPFDGTTSVGFDVPAEGGRLVIDVYDVRGRRVRTLLNGYRDAGRHRVTWDGTDAAGERAAPGVYFVRLTANGAAETRKVTKVR
jgi:M6 family metalloprotease-like protein